jgi:glycerol-3-phosphate dehydrogenase
MGDVRRFAPAELPGVADVLVIGGGITGASVARDAALRGLSTVLVERDDVASGTSSRSSKLIHGGLRYLQTYQFRLVHESVREREVMMRIAPHRARLEPFLYLVYDGYPEQGGLVNLGLTVYDVFARAPLRRRHRMLGRDAVLHREPHLNPEGLRGAGLYHDAATDDARLTLDVLESAHRAGALVANHREAVGLVRERDRVAGAEIRDRITGEETIVRARTVVNAAGPWVDAVLGLEQPVGHPTLRPSKGVHIVLRTEDLPLRTAVFLRSPTDGRVVWPIPAGDDRHVYVGTTDTAFSGSADDVVADERDVAYLLAVANHAVPEARVGPEHVVGSWAGLRPIVAPPPDTSNADAPREHVVTETASGMITVAGGKLTTARRMARQAVDAVVATLGEHHGVRGVPPSSTERVAIAGGASAELFRAERAVAGSGADERTRRRWLRRYGGAAERVAAGDPTRIADTELTAAEVAHAVREEMAMTVSDVLVRRTGSFFWSDDGEDRAVDAVSDALDVAHGFGPDVRATQQKDYRTWVARNRP